MKKIIYVLVITLVCLLCSCGKDAKDNTPILNENGKEEIVLCVPLASAYMKNAVVNYNKQSDKYEIVMLVCPDDVSVFDFRRNIQLELSNGGGPDILYDTSFTDLNMFPYAEDGYLMDVTDFLNKQTDIIEVAKRYTEIDDRIYAVPINMAISTVCVLDRYAIEQKDNTLEYWMKLTEETNSVFGNSGVYLLKLFGVGVDGIQLFVDEENGVSNFEQIEFVELLEFSKKHQYVDTGETKTERIASGKQIFWEAGIRTFSQFWFLESAFKEVPSYIGYPTDEGGQHTLLCYSYAINNASKHKEGALDFLNFLLSDEQQRLSFKEGEGFPVRNSILTKVWDEALQEPYKEDENAIGYSKFDIYYEPREMKKEEETIFWEMLNNPLYEYYCNPIRDIVEEETKPFFDGDKTAEEVAKIIDNRVQLYLDETK